MAFRNIQLLTHEEETYWLREWTMDDLPSLMRYANNAKISNNLTNKFPHPYTEESGRMFLSTITELDPPRVLCIANDEEAVGAIGIHPQADIWCKNMELGYWLAEPFWGRGIITRAVETVVVYGFQQFDASRIFARPFGSNIGSQKVLEKAGFELEARLEKTIFKNGQYEDELIYGIRRSQLKMADVA